MSDFYVESPIMCDDCGFEHGSCRCNMSDLELDEIEKAEAESRDGLHNALEISGLI